jgi:hypothetical protein
MSGLSFFPTSVRGRYGLVIVEANCGGAPAHGVACVRRPGGTWEEVDARGLAERHAPGELGAAWKFRSWVPKADGGVAVLFDSARLGIGLADVATGSLTVFDATLERGITPWSHGTSPQPRYTVLADGTLCGFSPTSAIAADAQGHVRTDQREFAQVSSAGANALAREHDGRLWQTTDYGEHWVEVTRPPFETFPVPRTATGEAGIRHYIECSPVGCALSHESGIGNWLRFGWPKDPPRALGPSSESAPQPTPALPRARAESRVSLPRLRCAPTAPTAQPTAIEGTPRTPSSSKTLQHFAGQRVPARRGGIDIVHRDNSSISELSDRYALRALVRVPELKPGFDFPDSFEALAATRAAFYVSFVEPFDPAAVTHRAMGSFRSWKLPLEESDSSWYREEGGARPVLGTQPGHSNGVLLDNEAFKFWVAASGKIRTLGNRCRPDSAYADPHGKLFVLCGGFEGEGSLEGEGGRVLLTLPKVHFHREKPPGADSYPHYGRFQNPDAIAVAEDGKLGILRVASGVEPATNDNPAWLIRTDSPPLELAPWSSLEPATSHACTRSSDGYRAIVQTKVAWVEVEGARPAWPGMTALVRWSPERVCLEALEVGLRLDTAHQDPLRDNIENLESRLDSQVAVLVVARFTGADRRAAFVGTGAQRTIREPAVCELPVSFTHDSESSPSTARADNAKSSLMGNSSRADRRAPRR